MSIQDLYQRLIGDGKLDTLAQRLDFNASYLESLTGAYRTEAVRSVVCPVFPAGRIVVRDLGAIAPPGEGASLKLEGVGDGGPFVGMRVVVEIGLVEQSDTLPEVTMTLQAVGGALDQSWNVARSFPAYQGSWVAGIEFPVFEGIDTPSVFVSSHDLSEPSFPAGAILSGLVRLDSLKGPVHALLLGEEGRGTLTQVFGVIVGAAPDINAPDQVWPYIRIEGGLPPEQTRTLGGFISIENLLFSATGEPEYSTAQRQWSVMSSFGWMADVVFPAQPTPHRIPVAIKLEQYSESARIVSNLSDGIRMDINGLSALVPHTPLALPATGFELVGQLELKQIEMMLNTAASPRECIEWVSLSVDTSNDNAWAFFDGLLTLQSIDFSFFIRQPFGGNPSVEVTLSGFMGIGERGFLCVSSIFGANADQLDYRLHGNLLDGAEIDIKEVLTHFLGHDHHPDLPELWIRNLGLAIAPRQKSFSGFIKLYGEWPIANVGRFYLDDLSFGLSRTGENDTSFQARGAFRLGQTNVFVSADYLSGGHGWTFAGGTQDGGTIPIGTFVADIASLLDTDRADIPPTIAELKLSDVGVRFNTATQDFSFHGTAAFPVNGETNASSQAALTVHVDLQHPPPSANAPDIPTKPLVSFGGRLHLFNRDFAVAFDSAPAADDLLVASYASHGGDKVDLHDLIAQFSTNLAYGVPPGLNIALDHVQIAFSKKSTSPNAVEDPNRPEHRFLFGVELGGGIELSKLPLVGYYFNPTQTLAVVVQLILASGTFRQAEVERINKLSAPSATKFPPRDIDITPPNSNVQIHTALRIGGTTYPMRQPYSAGPLTSYAIPITAVPPAQNALMQWFDVQQAFGAFHFERAGIGLTADYQSIALVFDASVQLGALTISLAGLGADLKLAELGAQQLRPRFHLDGLGISYQSGNLQIGGALLRKPTTADTYEYDGAVVVHYDKLGIVGIGSYAETEDKHPSLFVYALVDYPLGGPPCFFVEGLAFGFGYNRSLNVPSFERIATFPLVALARTPDATQTPAQVATSLASYISVTEGEYFVTAGVKFNSFKTVDGFALLAVSFGRRFEIDVIGEATLTVPPQSIAANLPSLMNAKLGLHARYSPDVGVLQIQGALSPDAHLFSEACHLSGGFAFYSWFKDQANDVKAGEFVLTMGGYHPMFVVPSHFPKVPRLALNWSVTPNLSIKADAYFALTSSALMAGGHIRADWEDDNLRAWFSAGVDCLIGWQPYHYEVEIDVSIGIVYETWVHTYTADLSAHLEIWGPRFSGKAHVKWWIISFDVGWGDDSRRPPPLPSWQEFRHGFLPEPANVLTVTAQSGKSAHHGTSATEAKSNNSRNHLGTINAQDLCIRVDSAIPMTYGQVLGKTLADRRKSIGITPMGKSVLDAKIQIDISPNDGQFQTTPIETSVPTALWKSPRRSTEKTDPLIPTGLQGERLVRALTGFEIRAVPVPQTSPGIVANLQDSSPALAKVSAPDAIASFTRRDAKDDDSERKRIADGVQRPDTRRNRKTVFDALLPGATCDWTSVTVAALRAAPGSVA